MSRKILGNVLSGGRQAYPAGGGRPLARAKPLVWTVAVAAMAGWSLLAWLAYLAADPILAWLAANAAGLVQDGQGAVATFGGKSAAEALKALDAGGLVGQLLGIVAVVAKPAIVAVWALGMLGLLAIPALAAVAGRVLGRR